MKHLLLISALFTLSACTIQPINTATIALDQVESQVRSARIAYQSRMGRVTKDYICNGMPWKDLDKMTGNDPKFLQAVKDACKE